MVALAPMLAPRFDQRLPVLVLARHVAARIDDVGEHHRRPAEHVVFEDHAGVERHVVLDLDVVADDHVRRDDHVLPDVAAAADPARGMTWQKCQIFVPSPISQPSSTKEDG